jgi:hypothetical protein
MKLHELEVGKEYFQVDGNTDVVYKIDKDERNKNDKKLYLWYRYKRAKSWFWRSIDITLVIGEFKEYIPPSVKWEDWEERRLYYIADYPKDDFCFYFKFQNRLYVLDQEDCSACGMSLNEFLLYRWTPTGEVYKGEDI